MASRGREGTSLRDLMDTLRVGPDGGRRLIPSMDPSGGGLQSSILVLMERPAPSTTTRLQNGTDIVCGEETQNASVRAFVAAREESGLARTDYLRWNVIPWASAPTKNDREAGGRRPVTTSRSPCAELDAARDALHLLLRSMSTLNVIVTLGEPALTGVMRYFTLHDEPCLHYVLAAPHPSPANGAHRREQHRRIVNALRRGASL